MIVERARKRIEYSIHATTVLGVILIALYSIILTPAISGRILYYAVGFGLGIAAPVIALHMVWINRRMHKIAVFLGEAQSKDLNSTTAAEALALAVHFPMISPLLGLCIWSFGGMGAVFGSYLAMEWHFLPLEMLITYQGIFFSAVIINIFQFYFSSRILDPVTSAIIRRDPTVLDQNLNLRRRPLGFTFLVTIVPLIIISLIVAGLAGYRKAESTLQDWIGMDHIGEINEITAKIQTLNLADPADLAKVGSIIQNSNTSNKPEIWLIDTSDAVLKGEQLKTYRKENQGKEEYWRKDLISGQGHGQPLAMIENLEKVTKDAPHKPAVVYNPFNKYEQICQRIDVPQAVPPRYFYLVMNYPWSAFSHNLNGLIVITLSLISITILIAGGVAYIASRDISISIGHLAEFTESVSRGEIHEDVFYHANDEVGDLSLSLRHMGRNLREIIQRLHEAADNLDQATMAIEETSNSVSEGARQQEVSVENTFTSMMEMNMNIQGIAENVDILSASTEESSSSVFQLTASVARITESVDVLSEAVNNTSSSITEMSSALDQVADNTLNLSTLVEQTASSMAEMDATIRQIEDHAKESASWSEGVTKEAEEGERSVSKSSEGMRAIAQVVESVQGVINRLGERAEEIGKIVQVIDEVATQTNLLALNAAIIAAQAGEHGRGFAVVADEIKELAERTGISTRDIHQLITHVQEEIQEAVVGVDKQTTSVAEGQRLSDQAIKSLGKILENTRQATARIQDIARSTVEQTISSKQISTAIDSVAEMVNQISVATQQQSKGGAMITSSVEEMKDVARQVKRNTDEQLQGSRLINKSIENITSMLQSINIAQQEQKKGSNQVVQVIERIKGISQDNVDNSARLAKVIDKLKSQSVILRGEVQKFKV